MCGVLRSMWDKRSNVANISDIFILGVFECMVSLYFVWNNVLTRLITTLFPTSTSRQQGEALSCGVPCEL